MFQVLKIHNQNIHVLNFADNLNLIIHSDKEFFDQNAFDF